MNTSPEEIKSESFQGGSQGNDLQNSDLQAPAPQNTATSSNQVDSFSKTPRPPVELSAVPVSEEKSFSAPDRVPAKPTISKSVVLVIMLILIILAVALIVVFIYAKPKIVLKNLPPQAKVLFDGKEYQSATISSSPGIHYLSISLPGYVTLEKQIELKYFLRIEQEAKLRPLPQARQIITNYAFSLSQDDQNFVYFLDSNNQTIYKLTIIEDKTVQIPLTPVLKQKISKVIFSPDFSLAIFKLENGETGIYDFSRYDFLNQEYTAWGTNIGDVIWRQDGKKILYYEEVDNKKILTLADKNRENIDRLIHLDEYQIDQAPELDWTTDQKTVLLISGKALYLFDVNSKKPPSLVARDGVESAKFSPDGSKLIFTQNNQLKIIDFRSAVEISDNPDDIGKFSIKPIVDLGFEALADQAVFTQDSRRIIAYTAEGLVEYDISASKVKKFSYENRQKLIITDLRVSNNEKTLYFLAQDKQLMSLPLDKGDY